MFMQISDNASFIQWPRNNEENENAIFLYNIRLCAYN